MGKIFLRFHIALWIISPATNKIVVTHDAEQSTDQSCLVVMIYSQSGLSSLRSYPTDSTSTLTGQQALVLLIGNTISNLDTRPTSDNCYFTGECLTTHGPCSTTREALALSTEDSLGIKSRVVPSQVSMNARFVCPSFLRFKNPRTTHHSVTHLPSMQR